MPSVRLAALSAAGTVPVYLMYRPSTTAIMTVTTAMMITFRVSFFIKDQMLPFDVIYFLLCGFETVAQGDDAVVNAGVLGVRRKEAGAHELELLTGLCVLQAFFQLAALAHNNAFRVQVVLVIAALGDGVHVGLGEQLVVQAHLGIQVLAYLGCWVWLTLAIRN